MTGDEAPLSFSQLLRACETGEGVAAEGLTVVGPDAMEYAEQHIPCFPSLDKALDGGLYEGLYVLGAVSSLGKTAFCMQLADQLAKQGRHVLIFSLEMSAFELMARSVSRETFLADGSRRKQLAKTVRGVLDGRRYVKYSREERRHLEEAKRRYASYAGAV